MNLIILKKLMKKMLKRLRLLTFEIIDHFNGEETKESTEPSDVSEDGPEEPCLHH